MQYQWRIPHIRGLQRKNFLCNMELNDFGTLKTALFVVNRKVNKQNLMPLWWQFNCAIFDAARNQIPGEIREITICFAGPSVLQIVNKCVTFCALVRVKRTASTDLDYHNRIVEATEFLWQNVSPYIASNQKSISQLSIINLKSRCL